MRAVLVLSLLVSLLGGGGAVASADSELVVLPPVGGDGETVAAVKAALATARVGTVAKHDIDATCIADPGCLTRTGAELGARRVLAIRVAGTSTLELALVDVAAKLLLGTRDVQVAPKRLAKELGPALRKFVVDVPVEKAKALFAEGNEHYNLGEFAPALERYKLAYRVKPLPAFQFNIAQCHRKLGQYQDAIAMYQAYLVGVPDAENKAIVDSLIEESRAAIAEKQALATQLERDRLAAEQRKAEEARKAKEAEAAAAAERARVEEARIAAEREREKTYNQHPARKWMIVTGLVGLGTIGAGAYFGVQANDLQRSFDTAGCGHYPEMTLSAAAIARCQDDLDRGERAAFLANVLVGSGGAIVLASLIVYAIDPGNIERPSLAARATVAVSPTSFEVRVRW